MSINGNDRGSEQEGYPSAHSENREKQQSDDEKTTLAEDEQFVKAHSFAGWKVVLVTLAVVFCLGLLATGIGGYYVYSQLQAVDGDDDTVVQVNIPMGSSVPAIASILKEENLIHHERIFYYYVRYQGATDFHAGTYEFTRNMDVDQIITNLQEGRLHLESQTYTIPEGLTVEQVAERLANKGLVDEEEFLDVINTGDFSDIPFVAEIPEDVKGREFFLEGFLYPDTYEVQEGVSEEDIIRLMLNQFERNFEEEWLDGMEEQSMSLYEAVTLASIIEREAVLDEERPIISGVFHNRLDIDMMLQSCATIMYFLEDVNDITRLTYADLQIEHEYNTYLHDGLTPGPIASPGIQSLEAALFPEEHDYLFFVIKNDGSKGHNFAETYEEHLENNALSHGNMPEESAESDDEEAGSEDSEDENVASDEDTVEEND